MSRVGIVAVILGGLGLCGATAARCAPTDETAVDPQSCAVTNRALLNDAERALARGRFADAEALFPAMPPSDATIVGQIRAKLGQRQTTQALALALQAISARPQSAVLVDGLAEVRLGQGEPVEAAASLQTAIRLDPCLARAHYDLSRFLDLRGMAASAQRELDIAYRLQPTDSAIRRNWKTSQEPNPTPDTEIADMRKLAARPEETAEQKAEIASIIQAFEADKRGDCERV